ncbi:hypothetical protein C8N46_102470 [Kordia periserrulae]|uniref:Uncharacterized protein n=1 Tax=Kordia periserrulae TaxID=701523 RepID=A0A2T6C458_9FLAO|nr:hypothetical protein [Kordia periserrulae]PTX63067.1 hypothetical protein C8N46_102470 [Kordia periserrulae]
MKKRKTTSLKLSKKTISSFTSNELTGGTRTSNLCTAYCTLQCPPPPDTYWCDYTEGSACICL